LADEDETAGLSFEDALKRLEAIVRALESGDAPLDRAISLYEEGERLKRHCEARLKDAEVRIRQLQLDAQGQPVGEAPFAA
jgi:exodeoxyribonuclease VII small subunit